MYACKYEKKIGVLKIERITHFLTRRMPHKIGNILLLYTNTPIFVALFCVCFEVASFLNFCDFEVASFLFQFVSHVSKLRR